MGAGEEHEAMLDPNKRLTPLQRRRLKQGKPITSRLLNDAEKKHEDELDTDKLKEIQQKGNSSPPGKKENEQEDIAHRKTMRHEEHERRERVQKARQRELQEMAAKKAAERQAELEEDMMEKEMEEAKKRKQRAAELEAKYSNQQSSSQGQEEEAEEEAYEEEIDPDAYAADLERDRLEAMVDEAVNAEERRLRAQLDVGTPNEIEDAIRRLRNNDPRLIKVTLRQNTIDFPTAARLADAIAHNTTLLAMDFRYNKIGDYGCKLLADAIQTCPSIGELRVSPNDTGRTGTAALQEAARLSNFQAMSISSATLAMPEESFAPLLLRAPADEDEPEEA